MTWPQVNVARDRKYIRPAAGCAFDMYSVSRRRINTLPQISYLMLSIALLDCLLNKRDCFPTAK